MRKLKKLAAVFVCAAMLPGLLSSASASAEEIVIVSDEAFGEAASGDYAGADEVPVLSDSSAEEVQESALQGFLADTILAEGEAQGSSDEPVSLSGEMAGGAEDAGLIQAEGAGAEDLPEQAEDITGEENTMVSDMGEGLVIEEITPETDPMLEAVSETEPETESEGMLGGALQGTFGTRSAFGASSEISSNVCGQNYDRWASPMNSYLVDDGTGYLRIENFDDGILVERYDRRLLFQSQQLIGKELELFGGFYAGSNAYYFLFGSSNYEENDSKEVVRIVKYDKNWNRLGAASLCGANTTVPFEAGSARMTEYGGYLYVRTCHKMYKSAKDGKNHQSNLMIQVRISDMKITDSYSGVMNVSYGYVSHSFNQFILADDAGNLVGLDHGDAYPRGIVLGKYRQRAGSSTFQSQYSNLNLITFEGPIGENATGASIGGLEYSSSSYLTAGNSVPRDNMWANYGVRNIFVTSTSRSNFTASGSRVSWITSYSQDGGVTASTPQLVKCGPDRFLLMWDEMSTGSGRKSLYGLCYLFLDGNGNAVSSIAKVAGCLSDCRPIVSEQSVIWYVTDGTKLMFYRVNLDGTFQAEPGHLHEYEPELSFEHTELECGLVEETISNKLTTNTDGTITYVSSDPNVAQANPDGTIILKGLGTCTITADAAAGVNYRAKSLSYTLMVLNLAKQTIQAQSSFECTFGDKEFPLGAACQGNVKLVYSSDNEGVAKVSENGMVTICGVGTAEILVRAPRTESYTDASAEISIKVSPRNIGECRAAFSRIGPVSEDDCNTYVIVTDGDRILNSSTDYIGWAQNWTWIGYDVSGTYYIIKGRGNYTGSTQQYITPIRQTPVLTSAVMNSSGAVLKWEKESGALGYVIYRKQGSGKYQVAAEITDREETGWTDAAALTIQEPITYCIKAYTKNNSGTLLYTNSSNKKTLNQGTSDQGISDQETANAKTINKCSIKLSANSFTYNGKARKPSVTVKYNGKKLKQGRDYSVTYKNNKNAGKATVQIKGKGTYSGSVKKTFTIKKAAQSLKVSLSVKKLVRGKKAKLKVKGSFGKVTYASKNKKIAAVTSKGVVQGKAAGKVVITVKAAGDKNHKAASKKITVNVRKK